MIGKKLLMIAEKQGFQPEKAWELWECYFKPCCSCMHFYILGRSRKDPDRRKNCFLIIGSVLGHPKGVRGLTSNFFCRGGMDVF
jgi:hypothetical protein